jgi:hypothetical protein
MSDNYKVSVALCLGSLPAFKEMRPETEFWRTTVCLKQIFCNPILFAICGGTFSESCKNVYSGVYKRSQ